MDFKTCFFFGFILFLAEIFYFKTATHFGIIDKPNHRSSHTEQTVRGGGVIISLAFFLYAMYIRSGYGYFLSGLLIISTVSFIDDIKPLSSKIRIVIHLIAVSLMFAQINLYSLYFYIIPLALIFAIGTINVVNFMDGINGLTGLYCLIVLITLYYIDLSTFFTIPNLLLVSILAMLIFLFFNFRVKAVCFAGDVGSIGVAFILVFFICQLVLKTQNFSYMLLLLVYYLDAFTTVWFRIIRKENIFKAHRSHYYQYLANEKKISHLVVSTVYCLIQIIINFLILNLKPGPISLLFIVVISFISFIGLRFLTEGYKTLMGHRYAELNGDV